MPAKKYYMLNRGVDEASVFGGESVCCLDAAEIYRLDREWKCDLMDDFHEATPDEISEYGVYDSDSVEWGFYYAGAMLQEDLDYSIFEAVSNDYPNVCAELFWSEYAERHYVQHDEEFVVSGKKSMELC